MSTHCTIAMQNKDGSVDMVTCQMDGYLGYTGNILRRHYWKETKLRKLIALGNISVLAPTLKATTFYHRDFKEPEYMTCPQRFYSLKDYVDQAKFEEYNYIFKYDRDSAAYIWWVNTLNDYHDFKTMGQVLRERKVEKK